jgi:phosphoribosylformylglycinamidine synthase
VRDGELSSVHDVAEGGFLVAVAESCLGGGLGAALDLGDAEDLWTTLFGERSGGFVISGPRETLERLGEHVPVAIFGTVGGDRLDIAIADLGESWPLSELRDASSALAPLFP